MADNVTTNPGTGGDTIAADDIAGVKHQRVKIEHGADGSATDVSSASPLPVTLANTGSNSTAVKVDNSAVTQPVSASSLPLPTGAASSAKQDTGNTSLSNIDGKITAVDTGAVVVASGSITADTELTTADLDTGAGTDTRAVVGLVGSKSGGGVLIPGDSTKGLAVDLSATGANTNKLLVTPDLPSGASTAAKQPALGTAGTASADVLTVQGIASMTALKTDSSATTQPVSAASLPLPTGAATSALQTQPGVDIGDVTINNSTGAAAVNIQDGGNSITVDYATTGSGTATGALRVELPTNGTGTVGLNAGTNAIGKLAANSGVDIGDVDVTSLPVAFNTGTRSATTQRVTVATDDLVPVSMATNTPVGTVAHDAADSGAPVKVGAKANSALSTATMVASADRTDAVSDLDGAIIVRSQFPLGDLLSEATSNTDGASTASGIFTATATTRSVITAIHVFRTDAGTTPIYIDFRDGTAGSVIWRMVLPPNGGSIISDSTGIFRTSANTALAYDVSAATSTVYINVSGFKSKV